MLDGYLAAVSSGPSFVKPDKVLRWVWDAGRADQLTTAWWPKYSTPDWVACPQYGTMAAQLNWNGKKASKTVARKRHIEKV